MGTMRGDDQDRDPADRLDALWDATRPAEPSAEAWDRVWASVSDGLDRLQGPSAPASAPPRREGVIVHRPSPSPSRGRRVLVATSLIGLAQAAAILLAVGLSWGGPEPRPSLRIEEGQLVLIRADADKVEAIDLTGRLGAGGVDAWYLAYNLFEGTTGPGVVMSE
jgi:hypothetical protein